MWSNVGNVSVRRWRLANPSGDDRFYRWSASARDWILTSLAHLRWYYGNLMEVLEHRGIPGALRDASPRAKSPGFSTTNHIVNVFCPRPAYKQITFSKWAMAFGLEEMHVTHCYSGGGTTIKTIKIRFASHLMRCFNTLQLFHKSRRKKSFFGKSLLESEQMYFCRVAVKYINCFFNVSDIQGQKERKKSLFYRYLSRPKFES